jgi:nucleoside-diphosphate-sugar epimerase
MRVAILGASGNVGTSLLRALAAESSVSSILGIARHPPRATFPKTEWRQADIRSDELGSLFRDVDAVVHLAWAIQPSRDEAALRATNVMGSSRVLKAIRAAKVPALVYASSVGAYSPGPKNRFVDEHWPVDGIASSFYSRHKAEVEHMLDRFEAATRAVRVVRMRPALIFKHEAASGIRRLFAGPFLPSPLLRRALVPLVPAHPSLRFQGVHSDDVAEAFRLALVQPVRGAFNLAAEPVLDGPELARLAGARPVRVPKRILRTAVDVTWRLHLQPSPPGWVDLGFGVPLMDTVRARDMLGWSPGRTAAEALRELVAGFRKGAGAPTPPLDPASGGPLRSGEIASGVGERER